MPRENQSAHKIFFLIMFWLVGCRAFLALNIEFFEELADTVINATVLLLFLDSLLFLGPF